MNKIIRSQLEKVKVAKLPQWDNNTTFMVIKKGINKNPDSLEVGKYYLVRLADYVINEPEGFTLSTNWNSGRKPQCNAYKCEVVQIMGKMVKINGAGYSIEQDKDLDPMFHGWLPLASITVEGVLI